MNAGEINIAVTASMAQFNATMTAVKQSAAATATSTGEFFRNKLRDEFSEQKAGKVLGSVLGLGMADNFLRTMAQAIREDKSILAAVEELVANLPVIGGAYQFGKALGESMVDGAFGTVSKQEAQRQRMIDLEFQREREADEKAAAEREKRRKEFIEKDRERMRKVAQEQQDKEDLAIGTIFGQRRKMEAEIADFNLKVRVDALRKAGDEEAALRLEVEDAIAKKREELFEENPGLRDALRGAFGGEEEDLARQLMQDAEDRIREEYGYRLYLHKENLKEEEADRKKLVERENAEKLAALKKQLDEEEMSLDDRRREAATAGIGSAGTALGSFRFDAYPQSMKRENDERMVRAVEQLRDKVAAGGGFN
jgi:hypothetical protein